MSKLLKGGVLIFIVVLLNVLIYIVVPSNSFYLGGTILLSIIYSLFYVLFFNKKKIYSLPLFISTLQLIILLLGFLSKNLSPIDEFFSLINYAFFMGFKYLYNFLNFLGLHPILDIFLNSIGIFIFSYGVLLFTEFVFRYLFSKISSN
jgi:hypothetical protein